MYLQDMSAFGGGPVPVKVRKAIYQDPETGEQKVGYALMNGDKVVHLEPIEPKEKQNDD